MLGGGLPSNRAYMVTGSIHSGKRLLSLIIQKGCLLRGEYCLYVTYGQPYTTVLNRYKNIGLTPLEYMKSGLLRITDYYSLDYHTLDELMSDLSPIEQEHILFMLPEYLEDENKNREYVEFQKKSIAQIGKPGAVIIDSLNERLKRTPRDTVLRQFRRFKDRLSVKEGLLSLHLYTPLPGTDHFPIIEMFHYYEENSIELESTPNGKRRIRFRISMPPTIDNSWRDFTIRNNTILVKRDTESSNP